VPADFVLLRVMNGRADLVNLDIASGKLDAQGSRVPLRVIVDQSATLGFRYNRDFTLADDITGAGAVRIESDQVITFSGQNDYTGGTRIVKGTLRGRAASLPGDFTVDKDGVLDFRITDTTQVPTYAGNISGEGKLMKSGAGALLLSGGTATHTGGTEITTGTLQATPVSLTGNVAVSQGAQFWLLPTAGTPFAGAISGRGSVRKSGTQELQLTGLNNFSGGLFIQNGDVRATTANIPGNVTLEAVVAPDPPARLFFDQDVDGLHVGTISGTGSLVKQGTGRVVRQGTTNVSLVQVLGGSLAGDTAALGNAIEITNAGAIAEFSLADIQTYVGTISGPGDLWKTGSGTLVLAADSQHTGQTVVNAGTLQLQADLANSTLVRVDPGARLANVSGSIPNGRLVNQGRVAPGASTTSFSVSGNATMAAGSVLEVDLDAAGNASALVVGGTATLDAPSYALNISPGDYSAPTQYSVIVATNIAIAPGSSAGSTFDDLAFITVTSPPSVIASPGVAQVVFSLQEDFSNIPAYGTTPNQVATGVALGQVTNSGSADARTIRDGLVPLRVGQVPAVLDMMAGETLAAFTNSRIANARNFADTLLRRLHTSGWELTRPPTVSNVSSVASNELPAVGAARARGGSGVWLVPFGVFSNNEGNGNASDMESDTYGVTGGFDYRLPAGLRLPHSDNYRFGLAVGYTHHSLENTTGFMTGTGNTAQTALYGGYRSQHFHAGLAGRFAWTSMQSDRRIVFSDIDRNAMADFDGLEWGALTEVGGHFGDPKRALFHPTARFQYIRTTQDAFQETGAGDLDLSVPSLDYDSFLLTLGARVSRVFTLKGEFGIEPELRGGWTIDFGDLERQVPATFYVVPGAVPFVTTGAQPDMNSGSVGIGYLMTVGDVPLLSTHYDFEFGESFTRQVITAGLYFRW
jgi:fibronectin-binding autotransporter adhesin